MIYAIYLLEHLYFVAATEEEAKDICALSPVLSYEHVEYKGTLLELLARVELVKRMHWRRKNHLTP